jgi:hypothetical protein
MPKTGQGSLANNIPYEDGLTERVNAAADVGEYDIL